MSGEVMTFPNTWEEYEEQYGFNDTEQIYTNGSRLIQSFRVKQWLEHIEVSEEELRKKYKDFYEQGKFDALVEVSEDCISRKINAPRIVPMFEDCISKASVISALSLYRKTIETELGSRASAIADIVLGTIDDCIKLVGKAPSVTTEQSCDTCRHNKREWDSKECDGCTKANSNYEPTTEQSSTVGEWIERIGAISKMSFYQCSKCYGEVDTNVFDYCPWCGAKMNCNANQCVQRVEYVGDIEKSVVERAD